MTRSRMAPWPAYDATLTDTGRCSSRRNSASRSAGPIRAEARSGGRVEVDMGPAFLSWRQIPLAREMGIAALAIRNSYKCGVLGYHTERLVAIPIAGEVESLNAAVSGAVMLFEAARQRRLAP